MRPKLPNLAAIELLRDGSRYTAAERLSLDGETGHFDRTNFLFSAQFFVAGERSREIRGEVVAPR